MKQTDLDHLLRELRHKPRPGLGAKFADDVLRRLGSGAVVIPLSFLAIVTSALLLLSATIGWSVGWTHDHEDAATVPPPLVGFGASELLAFPE